MEIFGISTLGAILDRSIEPRGDVLAHRRELSAELQENCQKRNRNVFSETQNDERNIEKVELPSKTFEVCFYLQANFATNVNITLAGNARRHFAQ